SRESRALAQDRIRQASALLYAAAVAAAAGNQIGRSQRSRIRFSVEPGRCRGGPGAGHDRAHRRPHYPARGGGRRPRTRTPAQVDGRTLSHAARSFPARDRALLLGSSGCGLARDRGVPAAVRRRARGLWGVAAATLCRRSGAGLDRALRHRLCQLASVGGFRRNLGALFSYGRYARNRVRVRSAVAAQGGQGRGPGRGVDFDPYAAEMDRIIDAWLPLTFAVNSINRSMGQQDLYPFVLAPAAIWKLTFIHDQIHAVSADRPRDSEHNAIRAIIAGLKRAVGSPQIPG